MRASTTFTGSARSKCVPDRLSIASFISCWRRSLISSTPSTTSSCSSRYRIASAGDEPGRMAAASVFISAAIWRYCDQPQS